MQPLRANRTAGRRLLVAASLLLLGACASEPRYTPSALDEAEAAGRLEAVYAELRAPKSGLARLGGDDEAELAAVVERLVRRDLAALRARLDAARLPAPTEGLVPLSTFAEVSELVDAPARWSPVGRARAVTMLTEEEARTRAAIAERRRQAIVLPRREHLARLALYDQIGALGGAGSAEAIAAGQQRAESRSALVQTARSALIADRIADADAALAMLREIDAAHLELPRLDALLRLLQINAAMREAYDSAAQLAAWESLEVLASEMPLAELRPEGNFALSELRASQLVRAGGALAADRFGECHEALLQARMLGKVLDEMLPPPEENRFVDRLQRAADAAAARGESALEYGYRMVMHEMQPDYPMLRLTLQEAAERVREAALAPIDIVTTGDSEAAQVVAAGLAERLAARLANHLPHDLRLIAIRPLLPPMADPATAAREERAAAEAAGPSAAPPVAAPSTGEAQWELLLDVADAGIDIESVESLQRQRVQTDTVRVANPEHAAWAALPSGERAAAPEPPATVDTPIVEEVAIGVTRHRQRARLEMRYHLLETTPSGELFADAITLDRVVEGESHGAIEIGAYVLPARAAGLPAAAEMIDALVDEATVAVGKRLETIFGNNVARQTALAERAAVEATPLLEIEHHAAALAVAEAKGTSTAALRSALRERVLARRIAS